jgi:hypothetical protein
MRRIHFPMIASEPRAAHQLSLCVQSSAKDFVLQSTSRWDEIQERSPVSDERGPPFLDQIIVTARYWILVSAILACRSSEQTPGTAAASDSVSAAPVRTGDPIAPELSDPMRTALDDFAPGFERFALADYSPELVSSLSSERPSYKAEGDFNGDGLPDIGLFGRDRTRELVIAVVSNPDGSYKVFQLKEWPRPPVYNHNINIWLGSVKPGKVEVDYPEIVDSMRPNSLPHGAISVNYAGVSEVHYWTGSGFQWYSTSDD